MRHLRFALLVVFTSCATADTDRVADDPAGGDDLPLGDVSPDDLKADGEWGAALDCKPVPLVPALAQPRITLSIDGLTLRLTDAASGYDRVFPVGAGAIEHDPTRPEYRESMSYYPLIATGGHDFKITPATIQPCKTWWTDPASGERIPVFAGLPFLSFHGNYGIHGPIDSFRAPNGGKLRRGYVSHGCFRMEAADVLEVYARIKGVANVPVRLQREPERLPDGGRVDLPAKWIGASCNASADCNYPGGVCATNPLTQRGFCTARCTSTCADRPGTPTTFCVADPAAPGQGMCVPRARPENFECRPYDHFAPVAGVARFGQPAVTADVCLPGSRGWIGDRCLGDGDCRDGTACRGASAGRPGLCTMACDRFCADQPGAPDTFCAGVPALGAGGSCVRQCTPGSNASECPADTACVAQVRHGLGPTVTRHVCLPQ